MQSLCCQTSVVCVQVCPVVMVTPHDSFFYSSYSILYAPARAVTTAALLEHKGTLGMKTTPSRATRPEEAGSLTLWDSGSPWPLMDPLPNSSHGSLGFAKLGVELSHERCTTSAPRASRCCGTWEDSGKVCWKDACCVSNQLSALDSSP